MSLFRSIKVIFYAALCMVALNSNLFGMRPHARTLFPQDEQGPDAASADQLGSADEDADDEADETNYSVEFVESDDESSEKQAASRALSEALARERAFKAPKGPLTYEQAYLNRWGKRLLPSVRMGGVPVQVVEEQGTEEHVEEDRDLEIKWKKRAIAIESAWIEDYPAFRGQSIDDAHRILKKALKGAVSQEQLNVFANVVCRLYKYEQLQKNRNIISLRSLAKQITPELQKYFKTVGTIREQAKSFDWFMTVAQSLGIKALKLASVDAIVDTELFTKLTASESTYKFKAFMLLERRFYEETASLEDSNSLDNLVRHGFFPQGIEVESVDRIFEQLSLRYPLKPLERFIKRIEFLWIRQSLERSLSNLEVVENFAGRATFAKEFSRQKQTQDRDIKTDVKRDVPETPRDPNRFKPSAESEREFKALEKAYAARCAADKKAYEEADRTTDQVMEWAAKRRKKTEDELARGVNVTDPLIVPQDEVDKYEAEELEKKKVSQEALDDPDYDEAGVNALDEEELRWTKRKDKLFDGDDSDDHEEPGYYEVW